MTHSGCRHPEHIPNGTTIGNSLSTIWPIPPLQYAAVPHRILCISATDAILQTRKLLLESHHYEVVPALNFKDVEEACKLNKFDLALVGHDIEPKIKKAVGLKIREHRPNVPIVEMCRYSPEIDGSVFTIAESPADLLHIIGEVCAGRISARASRGIPGHQSSVGSDC